MLASADLSRAELRRQLRQQRRTLSPQQQRQAARLLYRQLAQHPLFRRARRIGLYLANDGEIDPALLLREAQRRGKQVFLPVLRPWPRTQMNLQRLLPGEPLVRNRFGIAEPVARPTRQVPLWTLDLLLLPLVGFDAHGGRLGMGGGFYDRSLAYLGRRRQWHAPRLLGLAHGCQQVDRLEMANWDVPLSATVSDSGWYRAANTGGRKAI